jgi:hypothetical protein
MGGNSDRARVEAGSTVSPLAPPPGRVQLGGPVLRTCGQMDTRSRGQLFAPRLKAMKKKPTVKTAKKQVQPGDVITRFPDGTLQVFAGEVGVDTGSVVVIEPRRIGQKRNGGVEIQTGMGDGIYPVVFRTTSKKNGSQPIEVTLLFDVMHGGDGVGIIAGLHEDEEIAYRRAGTIKVRNGQILVVDPCGLDEFLPPKDDPKNRLVADWGAVVIDCPNGDYPIIEEGFSTKYHDNIGSFFTTVSAWIDLDPQDLHGKRLEREFGKLTETAASLKKMWPTFMARLRRRFLPSGRKS